MTPPLGNGSRTVAPLTTRVVLGSKICPYVRARPAESTAGAAFIVRAVLGPLHWFEAMLKFRHPEVAKLPFRYAGVGTLMRPLEICRLSRYCSKLKKKKVRFSPL